MVWLASQFRMAGGLNEEDPQFTQKPGAAAFMQNFECLPGGGYRRLGGYDNWAGSWTSPYVDTYYKLYFTGGDRKPVAQGETVFTRENVELYGQCIGVVVTSGDWGGTAEGYLILTGYINQYDQIVDDTSVEDGYGGTIGFIAPGALVKAELSDPDYAEWVQKNKDYWRSQLPALGSFDGAGPILGVFTFEDEIYGWRSSSSDNSKAKLFNASNDNEITPMPYLPFDDGTAELSRGDFIIGGTSGTTADVYEVNIAFGNFAGPSYATGRLFLTNIVGAGFVNNEEIRIGASKRALVNGTLTTPTVLSGNTTARHTTIETNFYGIENRKAIYGCDGWNDPYCFDGEYLMFFDNTMATKPLYIEAHRQHLFLAYPGGSVQNSSTGLPMVWSVRFGASEIGIGDNPTGMKSNGNNTLAVMAERSVHIITGTSDLDWNIRVIGDDMTTLDGTLAAIGGQTLFLDHAGVSWLTPAPPTFQDYTTQQISRNVRKTIEAKADLALFAMSIPFKSQYRLFFSDKTFLIATFYANKLMGWSIGKYAHQMTCGCTGVVAGKLGTFMGSEDGYVMPVDFGESFFGEKIQSIIQLPFSYHGHTDREKRFHKITLEMETPATIDLRVHMDFDYGTGAQTGNFVAPTGATGGQWDISQWEQFYWDSGVLTAPETNIDGVGRNVAITLYHEERTAAPFTISAAMLQFSLYGVKR